METEITCILTEACGSDVPVERKVQEAVTTSTPADHNRGQQLLRRRKQINSSFLAPRNPYQLTNTYARRVVNKSKQFPEKLDEVTQRVLSGKEHRIKQLQNDLGVAQIKLCELVAENRLLRSLNKRNNAALSRFQDVEAELPSLLSVHNSEIRSLRERFSKLSFEHREQARELRSKDSALQSAREQLSSLNKLIEEKGLKERQILTEKLEEAKYTISELEEQHKNALRQLMLEKKSFKHQLGREQRRFNDLKLELNEAKNKISNLDSKLKIKEKFITDHLTRKEFHQARRNFASFKSISINSEQKTIATSSQVMSNRAQTSSTVRTCELHDDDEDDDVESELSFTMPNIPPSVDSIMNHLNYSSSDTDEEVSQIYKGRPTSVPQMALNTTSSTPWAVDSRTFSIRTTETSPVKINSAIRSVTTRQVSKVSTPIAAVPSPTHQRELVQSAASSICLQNENQQISDEQEDSEQTSETTECTNKEELTDTITIRGSLTRTTTPVPVSEREIKDNYSKEALLAALKAIDAQQVEDSSLDNTFSNPVPNESNHISSKKVELMQELFGNEETSTSLHDNVVTTEQ